MDGGNESWDGEIVKRKDEIWGRIMTTEVGLGLWAQP